MQKTPGYVSHRFRDPCSAQWRCIHFERNSTLYLRLDFPPELVEILVVSDGSTDETEAIVRSLGCGRVRLLRMPSRSGKAAALNAALEVATGEIVFFTDVRQPFWIRRLSAVLWRTSRDPDRRRGNRRAQAAPRRCRSNRRIWISTGVTKCGLARDVNRKSILSLITTGCIYAVRRLLVQSIPADTLADDAVIQLRTFFDGYRVIFDPTAIAFDYPVPCRAEFRRRMRTLAGLWQVHLRFPQLFLGRNRMRFHFLSHKFSRLVLPWAILAGPGVQRSLAAFRFPDAVAVDRTAVHPVGRDRPFPAVEPCGLRR